MPGMTNRPKREEDKNQQRVERRKDQLPDMERVNQRENPVGKDQANEPAERDRLSDTGAGRGLEHRGH